MAARSVLGLRRRSSRVPLLGLLAASALLFFGFTGTSLGAVTPHLVVSSTETVSGQTLMINASKPMADDAVARIQLVVPSGYLLNSPAGGMSVGKATARVVMRDSDPRTEQALTGSVIAIGPTDASIAYEASSCDTNQHLAAWMVQVSGRNGATPFSFPIFVDSQNGSGNAYVLVACFRPSDLPAGTANRSANGAAIDSFTLSLSPFTRPTAPGDYRWRSLWTPFTTGNGALNTAGNVEAQSVVTIPAGQAVIFGKKSITTVHGKKVVRVLITGQVLVGGEPVGPLLVKIRHGSSPTKLVSLGAVRTGTDSGYTKWVTLTAPVQYFQASARVPAKDLGAAGCQASFGVPCVDATAGAGRVISGTMLVKR
jgi:hypothetical protein